MRTALLFCSAYPPINGLLLHSNIMYGLQMTSEVIRSAEHVLAAPTAAGFARVWQRGKTLQMRVRALYSLGRPELFLGVLSVGMTSNHVDAIRSGFRGGARVLVR
jgi:hypothetical protein